MLRLLPTLCLVVLTAAACKRPAPREPIAGIYAVRTPGTIARGSLKKPVLRRAQPGVTLLSDARLKVEKGGLVLEVFDSSFVFLPPGNHDVKALKLQAFAPDGGSRAVVWLTDQAEKRVLPAPIVASRYEPPESLKKNPGDKEFESDVAFFFFPRSDEPENEDPAPAAPPPPWMVKERYIHALKRPAKPGDGARLLKQAKGPVVVEFTDQATAFADTLTLPLDLSDVRRLVVLDGGAATVALPSGKQVQLGPGEIGELGPMP